MITIRITPKKLHELRMLADWQVREMGIDPDSVTSACLEIDAEHEAEVRSWYDRADRFEN